MALYLGSRIILRKITLAWSGKTTQSLLPQQQGFDHGSEEVGFKANQGSVLQTTKPQNHR